MKFDRSQLIPLLIILPLVGAVVLRIAPEAQVITAAKNTAWLADREQLPQRALSALQFLQGVFPGEAYYWQVIGHQQYQANDLPAAVSSYEQAQQYGLLARSGRLELVQAYFNLDRGVEALPVLSALASVSHREAEYTEVYTLQRSHADFNGAYQTAGLWFAAFPRSEKAQWAYGALQAVYAPDAAETTLGELAGGSQAIEIAAGQILEALQTGRAAGEPAYTFVLLGQQFGSIGDWDLAELAYSTAVGQNPQYAEAFALLGVARTYLGKDGLADLVQANTLNPSSEIVQNAWVEYWRYQKQPANALVYLERLAAQHPLDGDWRAEIGALQTEQGDLVLALQSYLAAVEVEPANVALWRELALFSASNGMDWEAYTLPAAATALELDPEGIETLDMAGWINLSRNDLGNAEQFLQQALSIDANYPPALYHLAQVYLRSQRNSQAKEYLEQALELTTDLDLKLQAQRLYDENFAAGK